MRKLLVAFFLIASGCGSGPLVRDAPDLATPAAFPDHSAAQIVALMAATSAADSLESFESQVKVAVRSATRDADLTATIRQRASDTLWASARGPFGIEVARARATRDSFAVLDKLNGRVYVGPTNAASAFLPSPIDMGELFQTFLGTIAPDPAGSDTWTVSVEDGEGRRYILSDATRTRVFVVDPSTWRTVRYEEYRDGALVDERTFSAFDRVEGRVLPRRVQIRNPQEDAAVTIEHRKLALNPSPLRFPFSAGDADVQRVD